MNEPPTPDPPLLAAPQFPKRKRFSNWSDGTTIRVALAFAVLLTLASLIVAWPPRALGRWGTNLSDDWPLYALPLQLAAMGLFLAVGGVPRSKSARLGLAVINLVLLELVALVYTHEMATGLEVGVKAGIAATWVFVLAGLPFVIARIVVRRHTARPTTFTFGKFWFSAALLLVIAEPTALFIERLQERGARIRLPEALPEAPAGELHVATVGESSMIGFPYDEWFSIPKVVEWQLRQMYPRRKVVVDNVSGRSLNLAMALDRIRELKYRPHLLILYSGHNEFFQEMNELSGMVVSAQTHRFDQWLAWSPLFRVFDRQISRKILVRDMEGHDRHLVDTPAAPPRVLQFRLARFRGELEKLAQWCRGSEVPTLWFVPAGAEADYEPNRSCLDHAPSRAEEEEVKRISEEGRTLERSGRWNEAADIFRRGLDRFPGFADFHFQLAECLMRQGKHAEARKNYAMALEQDGHPSRMIEPYRRAVAEVAAQFAIPVVDVSNVLRPHSPFGILDRSVFLDHVHPNLRGYYELGMAAVNEIDRTGILRTRFGDPAPAGRTDFASAMQFSGMNAQDLAVAYDRIAVITGLTGRLRYEASRSNRDGAQFHDWSRRLSSKEIAPGQAGTEALK